MTVLVREDVESGKAGRPRLSVVGTASRDNLSIVSQDTVEAAQDVTIRRLLADDWIPDVDVLAVPRGIDLPIRRVMIWDAGTAAVAQGDLLLAVGVDTAVAALVDVLAVAGRSGAAAVLVKAPADAASLRAEADRAGVAVLALPRAYSWDWVHERTRGILATCAVQAASDATGDELYVLANAVAADLGAPVEIDDAALRVLAFSNLDHRLDELRTASILNRGVPAWAAQWLRDEGLQQRLRAAYQPMSIEPPGSARRLVAPIRAGIEVLGYVWAAETGDEFGPQAQRALARVARQAAAIMVRDRAPVGTDGWLRAGLLRGALDGADVADALATSLMATPASRFRLIGAQVSLSDTADPVDLRCLLAVAVMRADTVVAGSAGTTIGGRTYVLVDVAGIDERALRSLAGEIVERAANQLGAATVVAVGDVIDDVRSLPGARRGVDCMLDVIASDPGTQVGLADDLRPRVVLSELRGMVRDRPHLLQGRLSVLDELDRTQNTEYVATLRAYFDASCDRARAAQMLFVHRNTLRYRLQRIREISGLDLDDPVERLVAELQLRLG